MLILEAVIKSLIDPLSFSFILLAIANIIFLIKKTTKILKYVIGFSLTWSLFWSQPYVVDLLLYPLEYYLPEKIRKDSQQEISNATHIHVLACYYNASSNQPFISRWAECSHQRMIEAVRLHHQYQIPIVLTGGGVPKYANKSHAAFATQYLLSLGISKNQIITIERGTNTQTEVEGLTSLLDSKNLLVVSSATHIYRVNRIYHRYDIEPYLVPVDHLSSGLLTPYLSLPKSSSLDKTRRAFYEYSAIIKDSYSN